MDSVVYNLDWRKCADGYWNLHLTVNRFSQRYKFAYCVEKSKEKENALRTHTYKKAVPSLSSHLQSLNWIVSPHLKILRTIVSSQKLCATACLLKWWSMTHEKNRIYSASPEEKSNRDRSKINFAIFEKKLSETSSFFQIRGRSSCY